MPALVVVGEALFDLFGEAGKGLADSASFTPRAGGAPANLAVIAAKIGGDVGFVGRVGADGFGVGIKALMTAQGVDTRFLIQDLQRATMLAMVALPTPETPEFLLLPGANVALSAEDIPRSYLENSKILAFGSVTLAWQCRDAALHGARLARELGAEVVFDVNLRPNIWPSLEDARHATLEAVGIASVVKLNLEETRFLFGGTTLERAVEELLTLGPKMVCVSLGRRGSQFFTHDRTARHDAFRVEAVDATGSGDAFLAGICVTLSESARPIETLTVDDLAHMAAFSNACGALVATRLGAMNLDFGRDDVLDLMAKGAMDG